MTYSIFPSFNYIRPIFFIDGRTSNGEPCKDRWQGGIENTDRTSAILEPSKTVAKVATWQVVRHDRSEVVECHNLASARAIAEGRAPNLDTSFVDGHFTYKCEAFVAPSGQYYVNIHAGSQVVRMDVANARTARYYVKNGVDTELTFEAYSSNLSR